MFYKFTVTPKETSMVKEAKTFRFENAESRAIWTKAQWDSLACTLGVKVSNIETEYSEEELSSLVYKVSCVFEFVTDGDYSVNVDKVVGLVKDCSISVEQYSEYYRFSYSSSNERGNDPDIEIRNFVNKIISAIDFSNTHLYLMKNFYKMSEDAERWIMSHRNDTNENYFDCLGGNYNGTELSIKKEYVAREKTNEN